MGWTGGSHVFEAVAEALIVAEADDGVRRTVCTALIAALRDCGWDEEAESLGLYADDTAIRSAFGSHGITVTCHAEHVTEPWVCEEEESHTGDHRDCDGLTWPR